MTEEKQALIRHLRRHHPNLLGSAMDWGSTNWQAMTDQDAGLGSVSGALPISGLSDVPLFVLEAVHRAAHMGLYFRHDDDDWLCRSYEKDSFHAQQADRREETLSNE